MRGEVRTRLAAASDLADVAALDLEAFGASAWSVDAVRAELEGAGRTVLVAEDEGGVLGFASVLMAGDVADLTRIVVTPTHRRRGLATALLAGSVDAARDRGATRLLLEVSVDNTAALAMYAAHGFDRIAVRSGYYHDGSDAHVLEHVL